MEAKKILVIDDDPTILHLLKTRLAKAHGYHVLTAQEGAKGLQCAFDEAPDLILLDIMIPDKSGGDIVEILREDPRTQAIPVVFISVLLDAGGKKRIMIGEHEYRAVAKPFYLPELLAQIRKALNEKKGMVR